MKKILFLFALVILTGIFSINDAFAQVSPNGFIIKNDATGGNCTSIGTWDDVTNTCTLNIDIIIPTDGVGLYIYSQSGITIDGSGHSITGPGTSGIDNDGIRISGQSSNISIKDLTITNFKNGIQSSVTNGLTITGATIVNNKAYGIYELGNDSILIQDSNIDSNGFDGISLNGWNQSIGQGNGSCSGSGSIVLKSNQIQRSNNFGLTLNSINGVCVQENTISKNRSGMGIGGNNNKINNNNFIGNEGSGIRLNTSNGNTIQGNTLSGNGYGIQLSDSNNNQINSNTITASGATYGIWLDRSNGNTVSNNIQSGASYGLMTTNSYSGTIDSNSFKNDYSLGIYLNGVGGYKITNNVMESNGGGIQIDGGGGHTIEGNKINSNTNEGIRLGSSTNTISKNTINSNSVGISVLSGTAITSSNNIIKNNDFSKNLKGISMNGKNNQVYNNNFLTNTLQATVTGSGNMFDQGSSIGGNYWTNFDESLEGCNNIIPFDKYCDTPFVFSGAQDNYPWVLQNGLVPPPKDTDNDGISDSVDSCPTQPETVNGYQDTDGCPDVVPIKDTDGDGIPDSTDKCPTQPETVNGYQDTDGCPDTNPATIDTDNDGISDSLDQCPTQKETVNGFADLDGCPDVVPPTDTDGDGISDTIDQCPTQKETVNGFQDTDGCPDVVTPKDTDNDGIDDKIDQCPTQAETVNGYQDTDGCPDVLTIQDTDNDGIVNSADTCPLSPETVNGFQDTDGCPDVVPPTTPTDGPFTLPCSMQEKGDGVSSSSCYGFYQNSIARAEVGIKYNTGLFPITNYKSVGFFIDKNGNQGQNITVTLDKINPGESKTLVFTNPTMGFVSQFKMQMLGGTLVIETPDTIPPVVVVPNNMAIQATSNNPSPVTFSVSATDDKDGTITPTCLPKSGSNFAIGKTTVICTATDKAGNTATKSFTITITAPNSVQLSVSVSQGIEIPGFGKSINIKVINAVQTVQIEIIASNGDVIDTLSFPASANGEITQPWFIPKVLADGTYTVKVKDAQNTAQTTFEIGGTYIPPTDTDGDGISDSVDSCPTQKETVNGFQDTDGCPDVVPNMTICHNGNTLSIASPAVPAHIAHGDTLGACVTPVDTDGDGITDSNDKCPTKAETVNGFKDTDGCPDVDEKKALEDKKAADAKKAEDKKAADAKKADQKEIDDAKKAAQKEIDDAKKTSDAKKIAEKKLADAKKAAEKKLAEKKAEKIKIAKEKAKKIADAKKAKK